MAIENVYIGIVTYNSQFVIRRCLDSVAAQHSAPPVHLICVDNCSHDETIACIQDTAPHAHIIRNHENVGFACAHNQILRALDLHERDAYLALNPDVVLAPDYVAVLAAAL
jgi:GT2 family glycosyltransferase